MISIVFFGTPEFAIPSLEALADQTDFKIHAVVTNPNRKSGRGQNLAEPPVKIAAQKRDLTVLQPETLHSKEFTETMKRLRPDFFVVVSFGKLFPKELLTIPRVDTINVHPSLLPKYRGATPIPEALLHGDSETGITIMQMVEKLDSGDIFFARRLPIEPDDNSETLTKKLSVLAGQLLPSVLKDIHEGVLPPLPQDEKNAAYCSKITKSDGRIDWKRYTAEEILNQIRAYAPWPGCFTIWNKNPLKILKATVQNDGREKPGTIVLFDKNSFGIRAKKGFLAPLELQLPGKPITTTEQFLRGYERRLQEHPICS